MRSYGSLARLGEGGAAHVALTDRVAPKRNVLPTSQKGLGWGSSASEGLPILCTLGEVFIPAARRVKRLSREVTCLSLEHTAIIMEYSNQRAQRVIMENGFPFW